MHDDHEEMVDREIDRQAELMGGLTREDAEIMAHDRLNPGFGLTLAAEAALLADRRDAEAMARRTDVRGGANAFIGRMRPAQREYWLLPEQFA
jgi:hypothetical protein